MPCALLTISSIGARSPDTTRRFVSRLNNAFASYTHTCSSEEDLDLDRVALESLGDKIMYRTLELAFDVGNQGFSTQTFDLVVVFSTSLSISDTSQMMKSARRLLRPGGYLLCSRSVDDSLTGDTTAKYAGAGVGQHNTPPWALSVRRRELKAYGFADTNLPYSDYDTGLAPTPSKTTIIQAIDDRIQFLRNPLSEAIQYRLGSAEKITLIGGKTSSTSACAKRISEILQGRGGEITSMSSLADIGPHFDGKNIIVIQDHDKPLFEDFNTACLEGLKRLCSTSKNILWVTHGYKRNAPHARMLVAFARCLLQEMTHIRLQIIDFPSPSALDAKPVVKEFLRLERTAIWEEQGRLNDILWSVEPEIAYEKNCAFIPRVKPCKVKNDRYNSSRRVITQDVVSDGGTSTIQVRIEPVDHGKIFQDDKTYWLVGMTGDLGLSLCQRMIRKGAKHIALSSRNPKVDPQWLVHFRSLGAAVQVFTCDVTDYASTISTLGHITSCMPPIAGVCHGAMVLQDALFQNLDIARVEKVLKPKIDGAINLDKAFRDHSLDFFVMLSSVAATTGNPGQSMYAAANGFLAGLAATRRARGDCASTINLGAIIGTGVTRSLTTAQQKTLRNAGVMWTSEQDFHTAFAEAVIASQPGERSTGEFNTGVRICGAGEQFKPKHASSPIFSHMVSHGITRGHLTSSNAPSESVRARLLCATKEDVVMQVLEGEHACPLAVS